MERCGRERVAGTSDILMPGTHMFHPTHDLRVEGHKTEKVSAFALAKS